jgi:hypothetical protein
MAPDDLTTVIGRWVTTTAAGLAADRGAYLSTASLMPRCEVLVVVNLREGPVSLHADLGGSSDFTSAFGGTADMAEHASGRVPVEIDLACVKTQKFGRSWRPR